MEIRLIRKEEIDKCLTLMSSCFDKSIQGIFFLHEDSTLVAIENDEIIGGINLKLYPLRKGKLKMGYIGWVYVSEKARGRGIAKSLIDKAVSFMLEEGCTDIALCIEGDNPSSFKNVSSRECFSIMPLSSQIRRFGFNIFKVWKSASRFFDMGYFLWHYPESRKDVLNPNAGRELSALLITIILNTILFLPKLLYFHNETTVLFIPAITIALRTLILKAGRRRIFLSWDTSYLTSLIFAFLPIAFPSPGGVYPRGDNWKLKDESRNLGLSSIMAVIGELILAFIFRHSYAALSFILPMIMLDSFFSFYPFCGFLASRIRRFTGRKYPLFAVISIILLLIILFFH